MSPLQVSNTGPFLFKSQSVITNIIFKFEVFIVDYMFPDIAASPFGRDFLMKTECSQQLVKTLLHSLFSGPDKKSSRLREWVIWAQSEAQPCSGHNWMLKSRTL